MNLLAGRGWLRTGAHLLILGGVVYLASRVLTKLTGGISNAVPF
jgi:hypothetical protein